MEAPRCKLCGLRHWGACANSPSARAFAGERTTTKPLPRIVTADPPPHQQPKPKKAAYAGRPKRGKGKKPKKKKAAYAGAEHEKRGTYARGEGSKRGRPIASEAHLSVEHQKPWEAEGMSRRTWYRRKRPKPGEAVPR
jgi:hypothetical protein